MYASASPRRPNPRADLLTPCVHAAMISGRTVRAGEYSRADPRAPEYLVLTEGEPSMAGNSGVAQNTRSQSRQVGVPGSASARRPSGLSWGWMGRSVGQSSVIPIIETWLGRHL
jgi:hypothetical protein